MSDLSGKGNGCALAEGTCERWRAHFTDYFCCSFGQGICLPVFANYTVPGLANQEWRPKRR